MNALKLINDLARTRTDANERAGDFLCYARALAKAKGDPALAARQAEHDGASARVVEVLKSAVSAGTTADSSWASALTPYRVMSDGFLASLSSLSAFDAMLASGSMRRVPLQQKIVLVTTSLSGSAVGEGQSKPLTSGSLDLAAVAARKSVSAIVCTDELLKLGSSAAIALFNAELRLAVARSTDQTFLSTLYASTSPATSSGYTASAVVSDIRGLLNSVAPLATSKPYFICSPAAARALTLFGRDQSSPSFPGAALTGEGELLPGLPMLISDQLPLDSNSPASAVALLVDAASIVGDSGPVTLDASKYASLQMASGPDSPETASTVIEPLFQVGKVALRAERHYGFSIARASAVASLTNIQW
jgi:hypothetical protein